MEVDDELLLLRREPPPLDVGAEVVGPPEAAALAAAVEPRQFREVAPVAAAMLLYVLPQLIVLLRHPRALLHTGVGVAARRPSHNYYGKQ